MSHRTPIISFTFDDFPRSSWQTGGAILNEFGLRATYYASFGLMDKEAPVGRMFSRDDLAAVLSSANEIGSHTYSHCHSWRTNPREFRDSVLQNAKALAELAPNATFKTFSYPISEPRPRTKGLVSPYFVTCRGGGQTYNRGSIDLNYVAGFFLEKAGFDEVRQTIRETVKARGWLVFATHDVSSSPTRFGCTTEFFRDIVRHAAESGASVLPVSEACRVAFGKSDV